MTTRTRKSNPCGMDMHHLCGGFTGGRCECKCHRTCADCGRNVLLPKWHNANGQVICRRCGDPTYVPLTPNQRMNKMRDGLARVLGSGREEQEEDE